MHEVAAFDGVCKAKKDAKDDGRIHEKKSQTWTVV